MLLFDVFLGWILLLRRQSKDPLYVFCAAWVACSLPLASGLLRYEFLESDDLRFAVKLIMFAAAFVAGYILWRGSAVPGVNHNVEWAKMFDRTRAMGRFAWLCGMLGAGLSVLDFLLYGGASVTDLAEMRYSFMLREPSLPARLASVLTWGCLYCLVFALTFRRELGRRSFCFYLLPALGYLLAAYLSAGRQAAFHIVIFSIATALVNRHRSAPRSGRRDQPWGAIALISVGAVAYMGYVAVARNDRLMSDDKTEVLERLFAYQLAPPVQRLTEEVSPVVAGGTVEGLVYFSSSVALFKVFLDQPLPPPTFGALTFPFLFRQLEPLTGMNVISALDGKADMMRNAGVMDVGWATALGHYILDFGLAGTMALLFAQGIYSRATWDALRQAPDFNDVVIAVIVVVAAAYTPLLPATWESSVLILWLFCLFAKVMRHPFRVRK